MILLIPAFYDIEFSSKCIFGALPSNQEVWVYQQYVLMTIFPVEHHRNITDIVIEVKAYEEPLLSHTTTSTVLCLNHGVH